MKKICPRCSELLAQDASYCPLDGAELARSTDPHLGRTVSARYRLIQRIAAGATSTVYLARHVIIERLSAIKILRPDLGMNPAQRERFLREARAVNRINHESIVQITDFGEAEGVVFLVMEYLPGKSLAAHLAHGALGWPRAARIASKLSSALARAHQSGVIHRDLCPKNIILVDGDNRPTERGFGSLDDERVKLLAFGSAKLVDGPNLPHDEEAICASAYAAPESIRGEALDARADLYSLGMVLHEMLTGAPPDRGATDALLARAGGASDVPPELEALVRRLVSQSPEERPRDAFEVRDALEDVLLRSSGAPVAPKTASALMAAPPPAADIASRWRTALAEVEAGIDRARSRGGDSRARAERAAALADFARAKVECVDRAASSVAAHQAEVDRLEASGREFRSALGEALDELVRDCSREQAQIDAIDARRRAIAEEQAGGSGSGADALLWEDAVLETEASNRHDAVSDLAFQIDALKSEADTKNELLERELVQSTGVLEGSLSALRMLTSELIHMLDEAAQLTADSASR